MNEKELRTIAVDTVIKYAEEQGVKLRRLDFVEDATYTAVRFMYDESGVPLSIMIRVYYCGRWEKQLKKVKDRFLNYFNARLEDSCLSFSFTVNELEIIALKKNGNDKPDDDKIERVIEKINKLLLLSDKSRNPSEHEAIAASLQVQKLLAKYNLSLTDITGERTEEEVEQSIADVGKGKNWKFALAVAVANNFACKCYAVGREQIVFYGYKADIVAARRVYVYLFNVGNKLANQFARKYREENGYADGIYNSFCKGFVAGVKKELEKQCTALAIVVQPKVEESFKAFSESFGKGINTAIKANNRKAYDEGFIEGKRALNAQYIEG